jgi:hypothetical protein
MPQIDRYSFGHITIDGEEHTKDVIILPDRVVANWWRNEGHELILEDLEEVVDDLPKHLLIGTGAHGQVRPDASAIAALEERGIEVQVLRTGDAVQKYGQMNPATTAAAFHLTC